MTQINEADRLVKQGKDAYQHKDYQKAAEQFRQAVDIYNNNGEPITAAEIANNCSVAWVKAGNAQAALDIVMGTETIFAEAGDILHQGLAWGNRGTALEVLDRLDEALMAYEQSAEFLKQAGETEMRLYVMEALSELQFRTGKQLQALATMKAGLDGVKRPNPRQNILRKILDIPFKMLGGKS